MIMMMIMTRLVEDYDDDDEDSVPRLSFTGGGGRANHWPMAVSRGAPGDDHNDAADDDDDVDNDDDADNDDDVDNDAADDDDDDDDGDN